MAKISDRAIEIAEQYIGKLGVKHDAPWLRELMNASYNPAKWNPGENYCIAALCAIFETACIDEAAKFPFAYSKSTQLFYATARKNNFTGDTPERGDIIIFELGNSVEGHAELVTGMGYGGVTTIGFNTSSNVTGNQHAGDCVATKLRRFKDFPKTDLPKLWIRGYVKTSQL